MRWWPCYRGGVFDVGEAEFQARVIEASSEVPVVVDFWAAWCQPCRVLSPVLERLADEYGGRFVLAKVDVDANPSLAAAFSIQGIPAVKAFRDGQVVSEFVGAQPEAAIRAFLEEVAPGEDPAAPALEAEARGDLDAAESGYREVLAARPDHQEAMAGLARIQLSRGEEEAARKTLAPAARQGEVARVAAELDLRELAAAGGELGAAARLALGGDEGGALERLLGMIEDSSQLDRAREAVLAIFQRLGEDHPLTRESRPRLARALF